MALIDDQVNSWLKEKFLESSYYYPATMGDHDDIEIISADGSWECGCYSEYTRDDSFVLTATISTNGGNKTTTWDYGYWSSLPDFITELDEYIDGNDCRYAEDDEYYY